MKPLRVLIADDHPIYRAGLGTLVASQPDLELVGEAVTGTQAVELAVTARPDVVLMDLTMPGLDGISATSRISAAAPGVAVLVLTMFDDRDSVLAAMRAGARGYLVKGAGGEDAVRAIRAVANGEIIIGPEVAGVVLQRLTTDATGARPSPFPDLTERETEILRLLAAGHTNASIAERVHLSHKTVRNYISSIFRKLGVTGRVDAVIKAREAGL
ncbi:response regulator transcription factor [Planosporangium thailandense]|uniref:Response regulator transcription factor n=1 Tax=Planosporangium thailandense TaxID=765197 RepID=A0ABX0Y817_9ACTN|nr:response regulator transcription factor [Planosporangium thailandense]NJC74178.1 response regulator transcription factor [Planosporangium thailandense]